MKTLSDKEVEYNTLNMKCKLTGLYTGLDVKEFIKDLKENFLLDIERRCPRNKKSVSKQFIYRINALAGDKLLYTKEVKNGKN